MHSGASGAPHRCASKSSSLFRPVVKASRMVSGAVLLGWGGGGPFQESAVAAEQIGEQTVTLGRSHTPLSGEPETSGGGR